MKEKYIDFHSHILPLADHGSDGIEVSVRQLELAEEAGVGCIVATPHYYPYSQSVESFLEIREKAYGELSAAKRKDIEIIRGAEVLLCEGLYNLPELENLKIGAGSTVLIEMPEPPWSERLIVTLERVNSDRGLNVLLAHVDRYPQKDVEKLFSLGFRGQLNASALHIMVGRNKINKWIDSGSIAALGSDIHGLSRAYKDYSRAMSLLGKRGSEIQSRMYDLLAKA